jgi:hypothetical protein
MRSRIDMRPRLGSVIVGAGIGAALMYYLDPRLGARRRGIMRDKAIGLTNRTRGRTEKTGRNLGNHLRGAVLETFKWLTGEPPVTDSRLAERVRSKIGRLLEHPSSIEIEVRKGHILARGQLAPDSATRVINRIRRIRGVEDVEDRIERVV